ncbi:MAG: ankyrin repeat domain-containing protein, partial [Simkaniaceae bacterium]|nr:ankyrin repeat domain-containing protein [Simkaniaceae bacterium]
EESFIRFILDECPRLSGEPPLVSRFSDGDLSNAVINAARSMHEGILMRLLMNWDVRSNLKGSSIGLALRCVVRYQTPRLLDIMLETFDLFRQVNRNDVWKAIQNGAHCGKVFVIDRLLRKKWARNEIPDERLEMIFLQAAKHSEADVFNSLLSEDLIDEDEKLLSHRLFARGLDPVINSLIMEKKAESLGFLLQDIEICRRLSQPMLDQIIFFFMCEAKVEWLGPLLQDVDVCSEISGEKLGQLVHNLICTKEDRLLGVFLRSSMAYQRLPEKNLGQVIYHLMSSAQHELLELLLGDPKLQARVLDYHLGNILIHSIRINQTVSIKILIDSGARFRIPTKHLGMALIEAAHLDQPEVIQILIEKDDLRERLIANRSIEQAHHIANYLGHKRVLELLRRDGVND